jgi:hypothetical protein
MHDLTGVGVNTIKVYKKIESSDIHIDGLDKYIGKDAEIIIHIGDEIKDSWPDNFFDETYGFMKFEKISRDHQGNISERVIIK